MQDMNGPPKAAPQVGGMNPAAEAAPATSAETKQVVEEGLNIAVQAGLEVAEAAQQDPSIPEETVQKIGQATVLLSEAAEEVQGAAVMPQGSGVQPTGGPPAIG